MNEKTLTVLTNLQRGNVKQESPVSPDQRTIHELAAQGELHISTDHRLFDMEDSDGLTPLCWACGYGQEATVAMLIKAGANLDHKTKRGTTSLMFAASKGFFYIVRMLIHYGSDINAQDNFGNSALLYAAHQDRGWVIQELLSHGAELNLANLKSETPYSLSISKHNKSAQLSIESHLITLFKKVNCNIEA